MDNNIECFDSLFHEPNHKPYTMIVNWIYAPNRLRVYEGITITIRKT